MNEFFPKVAGVDPSALCIGPTMKTFLRCTQDKVFIRDCYSQFAEIIDSGKSINNVATCTDFIITGTPGIGKTMFLAYLTHWLVFVKNINVLFVKMFSAQEKVPILAYFFTANGVQKVTMEGMMKFKQDWWYLADSYPPGPSNAKRTVLVVSPRSTHSDIVNEFQKIAEYRYMPLWDRAELSSLEKSLGLATDWKRFEVLNGVPR